VKKKKEKRKKEVKLRKNFSVTVLVTVLLWVLLVAAIFLTNPNDFGILPLFFFLVFLTLTFTFSIVFINTRRGLIVSILCVIFLLLRYLDVGNILNLLLLTGVGVAAEFYFSNK
jgi:hypothetical protein